jgi:hypothetical protein
MPISRNLNSYTLNMQEFKSAVPEFYVPSVTPSMTRRQGRKCKQLLWKFKKKKSENTVTLKT